MVKRTGFNFSHIWRSKTILTVNVFSDACWVFDSRLAGWPWGWGFSNQLAALIGDEAGNLRGDENQWRWCRFRNLWQNAETDNWRPSQVGWSNCRSTRHRQSALGGFGSLATKVPQGKHRQRRDGRLVRGLQTSKTSTEQSCRGAVAVLLLCIGAFRSSTPVGRPRTCCTISPSVGLANWELCNFPQIFCYSLVVGRYGISARSKSHILKTKMNRLRGTSIGWYKSVDEHI